MSTPIQIIISVKDAASGPLDNVNKKVKQLGTAAKSSKIDITEFNRSLFAATATFKTFTSAFSSMFSTIEKGAEFDRVSDQFERLLGPKGDLFNNIREMTDASIDQFEALKSGIQLKSLGIVSSSRQVAELVSRAGVAAKMAGMESGEGIKNFTEFLKDGSIAHLEYLNMVARTNPALQAELAILKVSNGVMGDVVTTQEKLALGKKLLYMATVGQMKGNRDLLDTMKDLAQFTNFLKVEIGTFLGKALQPVIEHITQFTIKFRDGMESLRKNHKDILEVVKVFTILGSVLAIVIGTFGVFKGVLAGLSALGFGLPKFTGLLFLSILAFAGITDKVDGLVKKFELLGQFFKGIGQLFTSLFDPENFSRGIGKIDSSLYKLLNNAGVLTFATTIAKVMAVLKTFFNDTIFYIEKIAGGIDYVLGGIGHKFIQVLNILKGPWSHFWIDESPTLLNRFARWGTVAASILAVFAGFKLVKGLFGGVLSKIPIIGGLFGGNSDGSSRSKALWVRNADGFGGVGTGVAAGIANEKLGFLAELLGIRLVTSSAGAIWNTVKAIVVTGFTSFFGMILKVIPEILIGIAGAVFDATAGKWLRDKTGITTIENSLSKIKGKSGRFSPPASTSNNQTSEKSQAIIPPSETSEQRMDSLANEARTMDNATKVKFLDVIRQTVESNTGADKGKITEKEYTQLMQVGLDLLGKISRNTDSSRKPIDTRSKSMQN